MNYLSVGEYINNAKRGIWVSEWDGMGWNGKVIRVLLQAPINKDQQEVTIVLSAHC